MKKGNFRKTVLALALASLAAALPTAVVSVFAGCETALNELLGGSEDAEPDKKDKRVTDTDLTAKVPMPVAGREPKTDFSLNQYRGAVSWTPDLPDSGLFEIDTVYEARVTLTAAPGWTLYDVSAFTHEDADEVDYTPGSASVTITFPATDILVIESPGDIAPTLGDDPGGATTGTAVPLKVKLSLPDNWTAILGAIQQAGKYVSLDLSGCAMTNGGTFDPVESIDTGKNKIVSLVLPDAATRIVEGFGQGSTEEDDRIPFRHFSALENVSGLNIERIGECAFWYVITLKTADFPKATSIQPRIKIHIC